jgi:hypothetical protein
MSETSRVIFTSEEESTFRVMHERSEASVVKQAALQRNLLSVSWQA